MSVDCTDCTIYEPKPFHRKWFSHKFNGPGLRYEVGISIYTGHIVWVNGPFPCGHNPDIKIFTSLLKNQLLPSEIVVADGGYRDSKCRKNPSIFGQELSGRIRARHETCNRRLKTFKCIQPGFRHSLNNHGIYFHAVAHVVQMDILCGRGLFNLT